MKESKAMMKKEVSFMKKKGAPKSMLKHEMKEAGMKKMKAGGLAAAVVIGDSRVRQINRQINRQRRNGDGQGQEGWQLNVHGDAEESQARQVCPPKGQVISLGRAIA